MKQITRFFYRNSEYVVGKKDDFFIAIDVNDLDANGCLTRSLNGLQMFANRNLNNTLEEVKNHLDIKAYGFTKDDFESDRNLLFDVVMGKYRA